jgi:hypothetical protein
MQVDTAPVEHPPAVTAATVAGAGAPNTACNPLEEALDLTGSPCVQRSKRQKTAVLDLSCSPAAPPPAADADVVVVESVDLAHEQLPQQAAAIRAAAEATGTDDEVLISQVRLQLLGLQSGFEVPPVGLRSDKGSWFCRIVVRGRASGQVLFRQLGWQLAGACAG